MAVDAANRLRRLHIGIQTSQGRVWGDIFSYGIGLMILDVYPGNAEALTTTLRIRTILGASL